MHTHPLEARSIWPLLTSSTDRQFDQRLVGFLYASVYQVALLYQPLRRPAEVLMAYVARTIPRSLEEGRPLTVGAAEHQLCGSPGAAVVRIDCLARSLQQTFSLSLDPSPVCAFWPSVMQPVGLETLGAVLEATQAFFSTEPRDVVVDVVLRSLDLICGDLPVEVS